VLDLRGGLEVVERPDDWYIGVEGVRQRMLEENGRIEWTPPQYGKRMEDWLRNMGDWNISRRRFYGLPLPRRGTPRTPAGRPRSGRRAVPLDLRDPCHFTCARQ
jgi:hypothetical protein